MHNELANISSQNSEQIFCPLLVVIFCIQAYQCHKICLLMLSNRPILIIIPLVELVLREVLQNQWKNTRLNTSYVKSGDKVKSSFELVMQYPIVIQRAEDLLGILCRLFSHSAITEVTSELVKGDQSTGTLVQEFPGKHGMNQRYYSFVFSLVWIYYISFNFQIFHFYVFLLLCKILFNLFI